MLYILGHNFASKKRRGLAEEAPGIVLNEEAVGNSFEFSSIIVGGQFGPFCQNLSFLTFFSLFFGFSSLFYSCFQRFVGSVVSVAIVHVRAVLW